MQLKTDGIATRQPAEAHFAAGRVRKELNLLPEPLILRGRYPARRRIGSYEYSKGQVVEE